MLEYNIYIGYLYDIYGNLLTKKQQDYFENYYFNNLTLAEIGENNNISRNAVYKNLKEASDKLEYYEKVLKFYEKKEKIKKIISDCDKKEKILEILE